MNRRLPVVLGALAFATLVGATSSNAEAGGRFSVRIGGQARVHVGSSWHFARPAWRPNRWHVSGSIYVGPRYVYQPRPYYVYYPTYVPSYYEQTTYYPVAPAYTTPGVTVAVAPRAPLPKLGIGLFAGGSAVEAQDGGGANESDDMGLLARFRITPGLVIEGEMGKMSYDVDGYDNVRVDRRLGASLLYEIGAYNKWAPYILVGTGVQQAEVGGQFTTTQDYGEIGAGLRWAVTPKFHLAFDLRAGSRSTVSSDSNNTTVPTTNTGVSARTITPPTETSDESEEYTRGRLSAILYF
ncbi:MAG TPA: outer membrane beta-barrel protein [Kofleriaceae bacterium]|nr:outer membrane beta-barrel protein [Kofleriaceae bacterium]